MASIILWRDLVVLTERICKEFRLRRPRLLPLTNLRAQHHGDCDPKHVRRPVIRIRVHHVRRPTQPLSRTTILQTLIHELAHLRHPGHGPEHRALVREIAEWVG